MKLFRSALLMLGEAAAFGWFILKDLSFMAIFPLIPLGVVFYCLHRFSEIRLLDGLTAAFTSVAVAYTVSVGVFDGNGFFALLFLLIAVSLLAIKVPKEELHRISGWWMAAFLAVFVAMLIATLPGIRLQRDLPAVGNVADILIFYLLAFAEPLALGRSYRAAPLALGILLIPFSMASFWAMGGGAFSMAEYPYLSVWAGVAISSFHHIEGIILCLYYGAGALRLAHFWCNAVKFGSCITKKFIV